MDSYEHSIWRCCRLIWLASITCLLIPISVFPSTEGSSEFAKVVLAENSTGNLKNQFDELEQSLSASENRLQEARSFIDSFLTEINSTHNTDLTLFQVYDFIKENDDLESYLKDRKPSAELFP